MNKEMDVQVSPGNSRRDFKQQQNVANYLRQSVWETVANAESGHLGGTSSSAELMTALYFGGHLNFDPENPNMANRDRVMVRGFLGPLRYNLFSLIGWVKESELSTYRKLGSRLQGHEVMGTVPGIDITPAGSLGMLLSYGVGSSLVSRSRELNYRSFVFLGDGEEQEGNISEAARSAAALGLNNLVCILDKNSKQLSRSTIDVDRADINTVWEGYGWSVYEIENGHDIEEVNRIFGQAISDPSEKPRMIIANTIKGHGLPGAEEDVSGYHTISSFGREDLKEFVAQNIKPDREEIELLVKQMIRMPEKDNSSTDGQINGAELFFKADKFEGSIVESLMTLFEHASFLINAGYPVYVTTADLINKNQAKECGLEGLPNYIDVGIREQHMFAMAHGISVSDKSARVIVNSNDAFSYRAADQIHAISQGKSRVIVFGDDGGLSGACNGETHQSTGQPGILTMMPNTLLFEPSDAQDFWRATNYSMVNNPGLSYIRLYSGDSPLLPKLDDDIWNYRTYEPEDKPQVVLVSSGLTGFETYKAAQLLSKSGIPARSINVVSINSIRNDVFLDKLGSGVPVLTVYNGNPLILQSVVSSASMERQKDKPSAVYGHGFQVGTSGPLQDLVKYFKLDAEGIVDKAKIILRSGSQVV